MKTEYPTTVALPVATKYSLGVVSSSFVKQEKIDPREKEALNANMIKLATAATLLLTVTITKPAARANVPDTGGSVQQQRLVWRGSSKKGFLV